MFLIVDTETTGFEPESNSLLEIAGAWESGAYFARLVRPEHPISFAAMATHHITEEKARAAPPLSQISDELRQIVGTDGVIVGYHNAEFDRKFVPPWMSSLPYFCTYRCAMHLLPEAESHSNMALFYELRLGAEDVPDEAGRSPHRALYDAWITRSLALYLSDRAGGVEELVRLTREPVLLQRVKFGKHRGEQWSEVPRSYLRWVLRQDFDDDVLHTARHWLEA